MAKDQLEEAAEHAGAAEWQKAGQKLVSLAAKASALAAVSSLPFGVPATAAALAAAAASGFAGASFDKVSEWVGDTAEKRLADALKEEEDEDAQRARLRSALLSLVPELMAVIAKHSVTDLGRGERADFDELMRAVVKNGQAKAREEFDRDSIEVARRLGRIESLLTARDSQAHDESNDYGSGIRGLAVWKGVKLVAVANRPVTTRLSLFVDGTNKRERTRPASTSVLEAALSIVASPRIWSVASDVLIDGHTHRVRADFVTTLRSQEINLYVDGEKIGGE